MTEDEYRAVMNSNPKPGTALRNTKTGVVHQFGWGWLPRCGWGWNVGVDSPVEIVSAEHQSCRSCRRIKRASF